MKKLISSLTLVTIVAALSGCSAINPRTIAHPGGGPRASYGGSAMVGAGVGSLGFIGGPEVGIPTTAGGAGLGVAYAALNNNVFNKATIELTEHTLGHALAANQAKAFQMQDGRTVVTVQAEPLEDMKAAGPGNRWFHVTIWKNGNLAYLFDQNVDTKKCMVSNKQTLPITPIQLGVINTPITVQPPQQVAVPQAAAAPEQAPQPAAQPQTWQVPPGYALVPVSALPQPPVPPAAGTPAPVTAPVAAPVPAAR